MFDQLFFRSDALTRQLSAPLVDERRQYLTQCAAQGMSRRTLRMKARLLLSITEYLRLAARPDDTISLPEMHLWWKNLRRARLRLLRRGQANLRRAHAQRLHSGDPRRSDEPLPRARE